MNAFVKYGKFLMFATISVASQGLTSSARAERGDQPTDNRLGVEIQDQRGSVEILDYRRSVYDDQKYGKLTLGFGGGFREVASQTDNPIRLNLGFVELGTESKEVGPLQAYTTFRLGVERGKAGNLGFIANQLAVRLLNKNGLGDLAMGVDWSIVTKQSDALRPWTPTMTVSPFLGLSAGF